MKKIALFILTLLVPVTRILATSPLIACSVDIRSRFATRGQTYPEKLFGWDGCWIDNDNILFLSRAPKEKEDSIYRMSANGKDMKRLIKDAHFLSVSTP